MNPLFQTMMQNSPMGNMTNLVQRFQQFRNNFQGNPQQVVQQMMQSGRISQQQYNNAVQTAQQMAQYLK